MTTEQSGAAALRYDGRSWRAFWMSLGGAILSVLTLGFYRFWIRTRLRRYHWGALSIDGDPIEYTGRALELLIGALIAIAFLGVYIAVVYALFNVLSIAALSEDGLGPSVAFALTGLPLAPLWPYAAYRSQRYLLSRLNWRGVRFGLDLAAWRYAGRAIAWGAAQIVTLGLIAPVADFHKRKFITDRMHFGDRYFVLNGKAGQLYKSYVPLLVSLIALGALGVVFGLNEYGKRDLQEFDRAYADLELERLGFLVAAYAIGFVALIAWTWYRAARLAFFIRNTTLDGVALTSRVTAWRLFWVSISSGFLGALLVLLVVVPAFAALMAAAFQQGPDSFDPSGPTALWFQIGATAILLLAFSVWRAARDGFYVTRLLRAAAEAAEVGDLAALEQTRQTAKIEERGAEGFADALDVGAF